MANTKHSSKEEAQRKRGGSAGGLQDRRGWVIGVALTALLAMAALLLLARLPGVNHLGPLATALLLGLAWRGLGNVPESWRGGLEFSAKTLLRCGIVLLGVRLNFEVAAQAGPKVLLLATTVIVAGLSGITWLGRRLGLDATLAALIAVGSSICGASAVAAAAPALRARDEDAAMAIPLCSLVGTVAMLAFTLLQHVHPLSDERYGLWAGATLHEVAQVMAAVSVVPGAVELGTMTKLTRVVLLVPAILALAAWLRWRRGAKEQTPATSVAKPWFVAGFLLVGVLNTLAAHVWPLRETMLATVRGQTLGIAGVIMAMAMAGMGLQVDFGRLRAQGLRTLATASIGWLVLASLAGWEVFALTR